MKKIFIALFVSIIALFLSCEKDETKERTKKPVPPNENCPITKKRAEELGSYFESNIVDGNRIIKPWGGHHHEFSELEPLGWTSSDLHLAAMLSPHVDLATKTIRFADNDIAKFLSNKTLCPLTLNLLFSYLSDQEKKTFIEKIREIDSGDKPVTDIDKIIAHQDKRFSDLEKILAKNPKYHVKFPGKSAKNHFLGVGIAKTSWPSSADHQKMVEHLKYAYL